MSLDLFPPAIVLAQSLPGTVCRGEERGWGGGGESERRAVGGDVRVSDQGMLAFHMSVRESLPCGGLCKEGGHRKVNI